MPSTSEHAAVSLSEAAERLRRPEPSRPCLLAEPAGLEEINLDYAATTPPLAAAAEAVAAFLPWYGSIHRGGGKRSKVASEAYESARRAVGRFVSCPVGSSVVFVRNTTEAANLLAAALPDDSAILCSPFEHHANLLPWRSRAVTYLPFTRSAGELLDRTEESLTSAARRGKSIRLLAITGASNVTGEVPPIATLARLAHEHGARIFVDAAQLAPHRRIHLGELDVDFLAFSGHKLYAPFGAGALVVRDDALADGIPLLKGGGAVRYVTLEGVAWTDVPQRYEAGTPNVVGAVALAAACDALRAYGMDRIAARERHIAERLWAGLETIAGVRMLRLWPNVPDRVGVAAFTVAGYQPHDLAEILVSDWGIAVRSGAFCAHPLVAHLLGLGDDVTRSLLERITTGETLDVPGAVRVSIGLQTSEADIDTLLEALRSLPPARSL